MSGNRRYEQFEQHGYPLDEFVEKFKSQLPMNCVIFKVIQAIGISLRLCPGDALRCTKIVERIQVSTADENGNESHYLNPKRSPCVLLEDYPGSFKIASRYPDGYEFESVAELAEDFPEFILVKEELEIESLGVIINPGDRLKLISRQSNGVQEWIECKHIKSGTIMSLPLDMNLKMVKKLDSNIYTLSDLSRRFPVRVRRISDSSAEIRGLDLSIPGVPNDYDGVLILNKVKYLEAELCNSGETIEIAATANISILPQASRVKHYGPSQSIHDLAKKALPGRPIYASLACAGSNLGATSVSEDLALVAIHPAVGREGILVQGQTKGMIIPKNFPGEFKVNLSFIFYCSLSVFDITFLL